MTLVKKGSKFHPMSEFRLPAPRFDAVGGSGGAEASSPQQVFIERFRALEIPTTPQERASVIANLRNMETPLSGRPQAEWKKINIWFHSLQDVTLAKAGRVHIPSDSLRTVQACFVEDLDLYLAGLPQEESEMRRLFEAILVTGTSQYWDLERGLPSAMSEVYWDASRRLITPWARNT